MFKPETDYSINEDLMTRKEFQMLKTSIHKNVIENPYIVLFDSNRWIKKNLHTMLKSYQLFVGNFFSPSTPYTRLLMKWETGVGKTIGALRIASEYIRIYSELSDNVEFTGSVFVIGFTEEIFKKELLRFPQFGFISQKELDHLDALQGKINKGNLEAAEQYKELISRYKRRLTSRKKNGFYRFYGYKALSNKLFITKLNIVSMEREEIIEKINSGEIKLNTSFIDEFANSLVICDEIHRLYNSVEKNNWGIAIETVLNYNPSCRALFLSATPLNNSPTEIVDLLNLLLPKTHYPFVTEEDLFKNGQLTKEGVLKIEAFMRGRISFVRDVNPANFASKEIVGTAIPGIDLLKFIRCEMSDFHYQTYKSVFKGSLPIDGIYITDFCLPDPEANNPYKQLGLFRTGEIRDKYSEVSTAWRKQHGLFLKSNEISGDALSIKRDLPKISTKYTKMVQQILDDFKKSAGKTFIYHNSKQISGVFFIEEVLAANGIISHDSVPRDDTICMYCALPRKSHKLVDGGGESKNKEHHHFQAARMVMLHGDMDKKTVESLIDKFNKPGNTTGTKISILIASRFMKESYTLIAVRNIMVMSRPENISTLQQIIGRAVRDRVHQELPPEHRHVIIRLFVSSIPKCKELSYEEIKYKEKVESNKIVRKIEKIMHESAIDGLINKEMIWQQKNQQMDIEPYESNTKVKNTLKDSSFWAYYSDIEMEFIKYIIKTCFISYSPVWKYVDLFKTVRDPPFPVAINPALIDQKVFNVALDSLIFKYDNQVFKPIFMDNEIIEINGSYYTIVHYDEYYFLAGYNVENKDIYIDVESFNRRAHTVKSNTYSIKEYVYHDDKYNYTNKKERFINQWSIVDVRNMKGAIYSFGVNFHMQFIEECIMNVFLYYTSGKSSKHTTFYLKMIQYYGLFNLVAFVNTITENMAKKYANFVTYSGIEDSRENAQIKEKIAVSSPTWITTGMVQKYEYMIKQPGKKSVRADILPVGHFLGSQPRFFIDNEWITCPEYFKLSDFKENDYLVGYEERQDDFIDIKFKIRSPIQHIKKHADQRFIERGSACITKSKPQLLEICKKLSIPYNPKDNTYELCDRIKMELMTREMKARAANTKIRWFYMFFEEMPSV